MKTRTEADSTGAARAWVLASASGAMLAMAPLAASAQAGFTTTGNTLSGNIDLGVRQDRGSATVRSASSGSLLASRLTFGSLEELGGGLKAQVVLEAGLASDTGDGSAYPAGITTGLAFGRTAAVALGSDEWGYLSLGRQYTPLFVVSASGTGDVFAGSALGGVNTVYSMTSRTSNSIAYSYGYGPRTMLRPAPTHGFGAAVMFVPGEAAAPLPTNAGQQAGFNLSYGRGPWWLAYAFHQIRGSNTAISTTATVTDSPRLRQQTLTGSFNFGLARVVGGLNAGSNGLSNSAAALDRRNWQLGVALPFAGLHEFRAMVGRGNDRTTARKDFTTLQLAYTYALSRRTTLYAEVGTVRNSSTGSTALLNFTGTVAAGTSATSVAAGVLHRF